MLMQYSIPKGTFDILPKDHEEEDSWKNSDKWQYLESVIHATCADYGYKEIRTPIFERTELFIRGIGEGSDIVSKEMYSFIDKGERSMTLRPEGTASVLRSFVEHQLHSHPSLYKYYYIGPMFRYERPQSGRYRQFHQMGAEAIGIGSPQQDVEMIDMTTELYRRLGLKNLTVMLSSVGDAVSRLTYHEALRSYLAPHFEELSADSKVRFSKNILRIWDSKDSKDQELLQKAPLIQDFLEGETKEHFASVCHLLKKEGISYVINPKLVRGLDYYNKTVFEITSEDLGAQSSIGGGGRYDGFIETLGGPSLPSVGFATGLERVLQVMIKQQAFFPTAPHPFIFLIPMGEEGKKFCFTLACSLRHEKIPTEIDLSGKKVQHGLQMANHVSATYAIVIGDNELQAKQLQIKHMQTRQVHMTSIDDLVSKIKEMRKTDV